MTYERATAYVEGIGSGLDAIQGRDVLVRSVSISERPMRGETKAFVAIDISEIDAKGVAADEIVMYHAWSESLAQKFSEIPIDRFPLICKFVRVTTAAGFRVWSFE